MVINVLDRPGGGRAALRHLREESDEPPARVEEHLARAAEIGRQLGLSEQEIVARLRRNLEKK